MDRPVPDLHAVRRRDLLDRGYSRWQIDAMIRKGIIIPLGRSWLGTPQTPRRLAQALAMNARLSCADSVSLQGGWHVRTPHLHIAQRRGSRLREPTAGMPRLPVAHHPLLNTWPDEQPLIPLARSLDHVGRCLPPDEALMIFDSVLNRGLLPPGEVESALAGLPQKVRRAIGTPTARAQSGPESRIRRFFERLGVTVTAQWHVPGVGFTDLLVGEGLIVECDSVEHHVSAEAYLEDRRRDRALAAMGYVVVRLPFEAVILRWSGTQRYLRGLIRDRIHRVPPGRRGQLLVPPRHAA